MWLFVRRPGCRQRYEWSPEWESVGIFTSMWPIFSLHRPTSHFGTLRLINSFKTGEARLFRERMSSSCRSRWLPSRSVPLAPRTSSSLNHYQCFNVTGRSGAQRASTSQSLPLISIPFRSDSWTKDMYSKHEHMAEGCCDLIYRHTGRQCVHVTRGWRVDQMARG